MTLGPIDYVNGTLSLLFVLISISVGILLIWKYKKFKEITLLYVGITWIIMCEPWWPHSVSFIVSLFTGEGLDIRTFYFLAVTFIPIGLLAWLAAFTQFLYKSKQKIVVALVGVAMAIFEVIFFVVLALNPSIIAKKSTDVDYLNYPFILTFFLAVLGIFLVTGIIFASYAMKSEIRKNQIKGRILLIAIFLYTIGGGLDGAFEGIIGILIISRIMLALSSIMFYFGFVLPKWLEKILIKEK
ncbi:MAG: hypothetical protein GF311_27115 [Candidatus Lokiarchaeota archaeon]|nr:hypothetical protein [Candidatus Lokiarchaeota archaeon]